MLFKIHLFRQKLFLDCYFAGNFILTNSFLSFFNPIFSLFIEKFFNLTVLLNLIEVKRIKSIEKINNYLLEQIEILNQKYDLDTKMAKSFAYIAIIIISSMYALILISDALKIKCAKNIKCKKKKEKIITNIPSIQNKRISSELFTNINELDRYLVRYQIGLYNSAITQQLKHTNFA